MTKDRSIEDAAERLATLYDHAFGGKAKGRFRVTAKLIRDYLGRRRLYENDVRALSRALIERGFVLVDMDSFYVVMSANSFVNYRRANEECFP